MKKAKAVKPTENQQYFLTNEGSLVKTKPADDLQSIFDDLTYKPYTDDVDIVLDWYHKSGHAPQVTISKKELFSFKSLSISWLSDIKYWKNPCIKIHLSTKIALSIVISLSVDSFCIDYSILFALSSLRFSTTCLRGICA